MRVMLGRVSKPFLDENYHSNRPGAAMPSMYKNRDQGDLQDMYRRALAASWAAHAGELPADQCVEDIFNGGDGWKRDKSSTPRVTAHFEDDVSDGSSHRRPHHNRTPSGASGNSSKSQSTVTTVPRKGHKHTKSQETMGISPSMNDSEESSERGRAGGFRRHHEVDEFEAREDLIAWRLPDKVF